jgi:CheY-like chemotaxis protein
MSKKKNFIKVLLVEDNPGDARLTELAFKEGEVPVELDLARDGEEAMAFLRKEGRYANTDKPDLILLDLNMPKKDGREALKDIKSDPELQDIPVAILTTSEADRDILECYQMHANCYLVKPSRVEDFAELIRSTEKFWFNTARLPAG